MGVLLRGGQVFLDSSFRTADVFIDSAGVVHLGEGIHPDPGTRTVDLSGRFIFPGLADIHVHLREPGFSYKETIATGTAAAARGGFTAVGAMPNVSPPPDTVEELQEQIKAYRRNAQIQVFPYACLTQGGTGKGEVLDYAALAPYVIGFSDDGFGVQDEDLMRRVMTDIAAIGGIVAEHIEDLDLAADGYIHAGEYARRHGHRGKPAESEWKQLERDLRLVEETGCDYHACHLSTIRSVELIRQAKRAGLPVTAESAPHYLAMADDELRDHGRFRMNPPIRSRDDLECLQEALVDGTIDMVATDHAPHAAEEKDGPLVTSANGVTGLEVSLPVIYTEFVRSARMRMEDLVRVMGTAPRERFSLGGGTIEDGSLADLVVFNPDAHGPVDPASFLSRGKATPFEGADLYGAVDLTVAQGVPVWDPQGVVA